jgi:hypothetical protein
MFNYMSMCDVGDSLNVQLHIYPFLLTHYGMMLFFPLRETCTCSALKLLFLTDFRQILQNNKACWSGFRVAGLVLGFVYLLTIVSFVVLKLFKD